MIQFSNEMKVDLEFVNCDFINTNEAKCPSFGFGDLGLLNRG